MKQTFFSLKHSQSDVQWFALLFIGCAGFLGGCATQDPQNPPEVVYARKATPYYTVKEGDNLQSVASAHQMTEKDLIAVNDILSPYELIPGQKLIVQPTKMMMNNFESDGISVTQVSNPDPTHVPEGFVQTLTPEESAAIQNGQETPADAQALQTPEGEKQSQHETSSHEAHGSKNQSYIWPVKGKVIRKFGEKIGSTTHEGISILAPEGTPVHPLTEGTVYNANVDLPGLGKTVVIQHPNGTKSVYLHLKSVSVKPGQKVTPQTVIAKVGKTGNVKKPQLQIQLRAANNKPVDPMKVLP